ncbi:MAG: inositol monophosphatase family protein [Nitriliruptoraceae bacterium]
MTDLAILLQAAHELADLADELTMAGFRGHLDVRTKSDGSWVTEVDQAVERELRATIGARFPDHAVLGEEDGLDGPPDAPRWVIDPIDGTTNFVKGNPIFATLIGVQVDGQDVVGVASAPALHTRFDGVRGGVAHQDAREIQVSVVDRLADAEVSFGGLDHFHRIGRAAAVESLATGTARQRGYGDFWQHCLVAAGSTDVAVEAVVNLWDVSAVRVIVEAAGGRCTSLAGEPTADGGDVLSTNGHLHEQVLAIFGVPSASGTA